MRSGRVTQFDIRSADSTNLDMQLMYHRVGAAQDISNRREVPNRKTHGCEYVKVIRFSEQVKREI